MTWYRWEGSDLFLSIRLQPRASRNEVVGPQGDNLKVRLTSPPVDGKANAQLGAFLADQFKVPKSQVSLISGETGREKRIRIESPRRLPDWLPEAKN